MNNKINDTTVSSTKPVTIQLMEINDDSIRNIVTRNGFTSVKDWLVNYNKSFNTTLLNLYPIREKSSVTGKKITRKEFMSGLSEVSKEDFKDTLNFRYSRDFPYFRVTGKNIKYTCYYTSLNPDEFIYTVQKTRSVNQSQNN